MRDQVLQFIRERSLLRAGNRVAVAVSGGADSVALLRVLLELRPELGVVIFVAHFHHGLRGEQSDADEAFVANLAKHLGLEFFVGRGDVRDHALTSKLSIEAAGRELRYRWFSRLAEEQRLDAVATAHTLDDQAETVLLKFLRGAGTRGLAGIFPVLELRRAEADAVLLSDDSPAKTVDDAAPLPSAEAGSNSRTQTLDAGLAASSTRTSSPCLAIRPLLCVSRQEVEDYLTSVGQSWREDESNLDRRFLRNRVRHELLPLLERKFNPNIRAALSTLAEIARGEERFWQEQVERELTARLDRGPCQVLPPDTLDLKDFAALPLALQRRLLKSFAEQQGLTLDFEHVERLLRCALGEVLKTELPGGKMASRLGNFLHVRPPFESEARVTYRYPLPIPGEVHVAESRMTLRAEIVSAEFAAEAAPGELLSLDLMPTALLVRNWLPGDRYWPAHSRSEEKLKRLFGEKRIPATDRPNWPIVLCGAEVVWVRGFPVASPYQWKGEGSALRIEAIPR